MKGTLPSQGPEALALPSPREDTVHRAISALSRGTLSRPTRPVAELNFQPPGSTATNSAV